MNPDTLHGYHPGPLQIAMLRMMADGEWYETSSRTEQLSCVRMLDHRFVVRDPENSYRFTASAAGESYLAWLDARGAE